MADQVSSLIVRLVDQVTGTAKTIAQSLAGIGKAAKGASGVTVGDRLGAALARNQVGLQNARAGMMDAVAAGYVLNKTIGSTIRTAGEFEQAFADVKKVVEFPAEGALSAKNFAAEILNLSHRVPLAATELTKIAAAGGQANVALSELLGFTEAVAQVATAFEISTDEAGTSLAKLKSSLAMTNPDLMLLADHMNVLGNNMATSERQVLEVVTQVGSLGSVVGVETKHVAALGAAMTSAGSDASSAATGLRNAFIFLSQGEGMTKSQLAVFDKIGLSAKNFPKRMQTEGIMAIVDVLERIGKLPKEQQAANLSDLFGLRAVDAFAPMLNNLDLLKQSIGFVADDTANAGAAMREFNKRNDTFEARVAMLNNTFTDLKVTIGNALLPILNELIAKIKPVITAITEWVEANPKLTAGILAAVSALVSLKIAFAALNYLKFFTWGGILSFTKALADLTGASKLAGGRLWLLAGGFGAIAVAIGAFAYINWDEITAGFTAFMDGFKVDPATLASFSQSIDGIKDLTGLDLSALKMDAGSGQGWGEWLATFANNEIKQFAADLAGAVAELKAWKAFFLDGGWKEAGRAAIQGLWDGMIMLMDSVIAWVTNKAMALLQPFINLGAKIRDTIGGALGSGTSGAVAPAGGATSGGGGFARGGSMKSGDRRLVGENGPEIFEAGKSGRIIPNGAIGGGGRSPSATFNLTFNGPVTDDTVAQIKRVLKEEVRQAFRGVYGDTGMRFA